MAACDEQKGMGKEEYAAHIKDLATQIKDLVAELAAETVANDAVHFQDRVQEELTNKEMDEAAAENRDPEPGPHPLPADNGLSLLYEAEQSDLKFYKSNYEIDLLTFKESDVDEVETALKEEHLTWIVEMFGRGGDLPMPNAVDSPISTFDEIAGGDGLVDIETDPETGKVSVSVNDSSMLSDVASADSATLKDSVDSWDTGTADMFRRKFLPQIPIAGANQINVFKVMRNLLGAHKGLIAKAREDVDGIAHDGLAAVESCDGCSGGGDTDIGTWLGVAAGVTAIGAGIATLEFGGAGSALIGSGLTILSGASTTAQSLAGAEKDTKNTLGAESVEFVVDNIKDALEKTYADLDEGYDALANDGMTALVDVLGDPEHTKDICAPRPGAGDDGPAFADATQDNVIETIEG